MSAEDYKIRQYVLKKKQQKERARQIREARRKTEYDDTPNESRQSRQSVPSSYAYSSNINNENITNTINKRPAWNTKFNANNEDYVKIDDYNKVFLIIDELKKQINDLQSQMNDIKNENKSLKQEIINLKTTNDHNQFPTQQQSQPNYLNNNNSNHHNVSLSASHNFALTQQPQMTQLVVPMINKSVQISKSLKNLKRKHSARNIRNRANIRNESYEQYETVQMDTFNNYNSDESPKYSSSKDVIDKLNEMNVEDESEHIERIKCNQCDRKFAKQRIKDHIKICKKIFNKKRKVFNMKNKRIKNGHHHDGGHDDGEMRKIKQKKKVNWKMKSAMLRNAIKASRPNNDDEQNVFDQPVYNDDRVLCKYCGRKFAEETAKRHIPRCKNIIAKPKRLKRKR